MRSPRIQARLDTCPRCNSAIILALDAPIAGRPVKADPLPLDTEEELQALMAGKTTYDLHIQTWTAHRTLTTRLPEHMPHREHPVIADHTCPGPIPATHIPTPPTELPPGHHIEPDLFTPPDNIPF